MHYIDRFPRGWVKDIRTKYNFHDRRVDIFNLQKVKLLVIGFNAELASTYYYSYTPNPGVANFFMTTYPLESIERSDGPPILFSIICVSNFNMYVVHRCGTGGSMRACHAVGPGSIPGRDKFPG